MTKKLTANYYQKPALQLAKDLIGKFIVRKYRGKKIVAMITETEAYVGPHDKASHSFANKLTKRNAPMFMDGGHAYVYLIYGMYSMFNISAHDNNHPEAVLIRAVAVIPKPSPEESSVSNLINGPGKLCKYFHIDRKFSGIDLTKSKALWLEDRNIKIKKIKRSPRIGIDYAQEYKDKLWRFCI